MTEREYPKTPELDKMQACREGAQTIGEFIEWLREEQKVGFFKVAQTEEEGAVHLSYTPFCEDINVLLANFYNISLEKVEAERQEILEYIRTKHGDKPAPGFSLKAEGEELGDVNV